MNFFRIKTTWSNAELALLKLCLASIFIVIGAYFHEYLQSYYIPLLIVFAITVIWTVYLWVKKMKNRK